MFKAPKAKDTATFYDELIEGKVARSLWGADSRFDPGKIANAPSTIKHYEAIIAPYCKAEHRVLDIGCSTGGFTGILGKYCKDVTGIDLSQKAVDISNRHFEQVNLNNCQALLGNGESLDFEHNTFDLIQLIDVIHHAENPIQLMSEAANLLKPDGKVIIFEPNKYNIPLYLMCLLDRNEWGALEFGSKRTYQELLKDHFEIEKMDYNGLLVGPDSKIMLKISDFFTNNRNNSILGSQCPKIHLLLRKK